MTRAIYYPGADRSAQWAYGRYPGSVMNTNVVVLHTTETTSWPSYSTGYWPNLTYHPGAANPWRQHLPLNRSARALENAAGGAETNSLNCVQIEMVGTCDATYKRKYGGMFYDEPSAAVIEDLAKFAVFMYQEWGVKLQAAPKWLPYPKSYGAAGGQRFSATQWRNFYGWCGHEHVVENHHGDPGNFPIAKVLDRARAILGGTVTVETKPAPKPTEDTMPTADDIWDHRINPGPTADKIGGYTKDASYPARDLLVGAEARIRRLEDTESARYDDTLAKINQVETRLDAKLDAILAKLEGK